jgi:hypothetical protein
MLSSTLDCRGVAGGVIGVGGGDGGGVGGLASGLLKLIGFERGILS